LEHGVGPGFKFVHLGDDALPRNCTAITKSSKNIGTISGHMQNYEPTGYVVEYFMDSPDSDLSKSLFRSDMENLHNYGWIDRVSRAVVVELNLYNPHYDYFVFCQFLFELPSSGGVIPSHSITPFRYNVYETRSELNIAMADYARVAIAIYILAFVGISERKRNMKQRRAGYWYDLSLNGVSDYGIVACILCVVIWRRAYFTWGVKFCVDY